LADRTEHEPNELRELVENLQVEAARSGASVGRLIGKGVSKLEGELLVITVTRAASLERPGQASNIPLASEASTAACFLQTGFQRVEVWGGRIGRRPASVTAGGRWSER
jgi:hypothetical protein